MTNILITGISGSGGSYLAEHLLKKNKKYKIFGTFRNKKVLKDFNCRNLIKNKNVKFIKCDLNNFNSISVILKKKFGYIYHIASNADVLSSFKSPYNLVKNNTLCTLNLLEALRLNQSKARILICSTSEVYGNVPSNQQPIKESAKINPINPYAVSKLFQDFLSQNFCSIFKLNIVITRMFTYFNGRRDNLFASAFAKQIVEIENKQKNYLEHGYLGSQRSILDIRDAMEAYYLAATKGKIGEIYNIGGKEKATVGEVLDLLIKKSTKKIILRKNKNLLRPKDINFQIPCSKKFIQHTRWKQKYSADDSINLLLKETREKFKFNNTVI